MGQIRKWHANKPALTKSDHPWQSCECRVSASRPNPKTRVENKKAGPRFIFKELFILVLHATTKVPIRCVCSVPVSGSLEHTHTHLRRVFFQHDQVVFFHMRHRAFIMTQIIISKPGYLLIFVMQSVEDISRLVTK